jgi:hypothetical protein
LPELSTANIIFLLRCGPCKLAKAFKFCLGNNSNSLNATSSGEVGLQPFSEPSPPPPLPTPHGIQSLFTLSPDLDNNDDRPLYEYFPAKPGLPHSSSTSFKTISSLNSLAAGMKVTKLKPILLLVEDNEINMRVRCDLDVRLDKI